MILSIVYLLIITGVGVLVTYGISKSFNLVERLAVGIGIGLFIVSFIFYLFMINNIFPFNVVLTVVIIFLLFIISFIFGFTRIFKWIKNLSRKKLELKKIKKDNWYFIFIILGLLIAAVILSATTFWPITEWDALTLYDMRGRFFHDGLSFQDISKLDSYDTFNSGYYFSYPPFTSLIHASFYTLELLHPQIIYPFLFFALVIYLYKSLESSVGRINAAFYSLMLLTVPNLVFHSIVPYTNLVYTYYYFISSLLLVRYLSATHGDRGLLFLSGVMLAGSSWSRFVEPFYLVNILVLIYFLIKKRQRIINLLIYVFPLFSIRYLWSKTIEEFTQGAFILKDLDKQLLLKIFSANIFEIFQNTLLVIGGFVYDNLLIFGIFIFLVLIMRESYKRHKSHSDKMNIIVLILILDLLLIIAGTFILGLVFPDRPEIFDSIGRLGIIIFPFIIYFTAESKVINIESIIRPKGK